MNYIRPLALAALIGVTMFPLAAAYAHSDKNRESNGSSVEVAITPQGDVLVRGAKVTAVSSNNVGAQTTWGGTTLSWSVVTDSATEYFSKSGAKIAAANVAVGDTISFAGSWVAGSALSVKAKTIKNWNSAVDTVSQKGTVASVNPAALTFVMTYGSSTTTVNASGAVLTSGNASTTLSQFAVGDTVKVKGVFSADKNTFTATSVALSKKVTVEDRRSDRIKRWWLSDRSIFKFSFGH